MTQRREPRRGRMYDPFPLLLVCATLTCRAQNNTSCERDYQCDQGGSTMVCRSGRCVPGTPTNDAGSVDADVSVEAASDDGANDSASDTIALDSAPDTMTTFDGGVCDPINQLGCMSPQKCTVNPTLTMFMCGPAGVRGRDQPCASDNQCAAFTTCASVPGSPARCVKMCAADGDCVGVSPQSFCLLTLGTIAQACTTPCTPGMPQTCPGNTQNTDDCKPLCIPGGLCSWACLPSGNLGLGASCGMNPTLCSRGFSCINGQCARSCTPGTCPMGEMCQSNGTCAAVPDGSSDVVVQDETARPVIPPSRYVP